MENPSDSVKAPRKYKGHIDPAARTKLSEFQTPGAQDLYVEVVDLFVAAADGFVSRLASSDIESPAGPWKGIAHSWKSSSYSVGAIDLGDLCVAMEKSAADTIEARRELVEKITAEYRLCRAELLQIKEFILS